MTGYRTKDGGPLKLSRSKIDLFLECPRCFWMDVKKGIKRPRGPGFSLNSAVDHLLKKEFDLLRNEKKAHQLMKKYNVEAIPFAHEKLNQWRNNFSGIQYYHPEIELLIYGAIDDLWINNKKELHIVDYKSTSTSEKLTLDGEYKEVYKKQVEVYQWLFRKNGFLVSDTAYFVYANASKNREKFDGRLEFDLTILSYKGNSSWVEETIFKIKEILDRDKVPEVNVNCEFCLYNKKILNFLKY